MACTVVECLTSEVFIPEVGNRRPACTSEVEVEEEVADHRCTPDDVSSEG